MKTKKQLEKMYDQLLSFALVNRDELELVICINGFNEKTMNDIVFARHGYETLDQLIDCFPNC